VKTVGWLGGAVSVLVAGILVLTVIGGVAALALPATASRAASADVPAGVLALDQAAAADCPGLPWTVLAAIGTVESDSGRSQLPGVQSGANAAGAEGPMQFEPATFARYARPVPPGGADPPSPYDMTDAVWAAARDLCANGADGGQNLPGAVLAYTHDPAYVARVLALAATYGAPAAAGAAGSKAGEAAADWALAQVGTPYAWGAEAPGVGFDCSGLVQAAYQAAGIRLPRVAQDQFDAGPQLPPGTVLEPGDLVFFGVSGHEVEHVGLDVGTENGQAVMVDAPHAGADVRVEPFPSVPGSAFGSAAYLGATRPGNAA
jgi:cell wall-associated NlpC family hydrolase